MTVRRRVPYQVTQHPDDKIGRRGPLTLESVIPKRVDYLLEQSYHPRVTRMDRAPFGPQPGRDGELRNGPLVTVEVPFTLVGGATAIVIASQDPNRKQLILQNKDAVDDLFYAFGSLADVTSKFVTPRATMLLDFNCPTDRITVFALVNISGGLSTVSPAG